MKIRQVQTHEVETLLTIARQTFIETYIDSTSIEDLNKYFEQAMTYDIFEQNLLTNDSRYYFIEVEKQIAGYLKLVDKDTKLLLQRIYVLSDFHSIGVGQKLMDYSLTVAKELNKHEVYLGVWSGNKKAIEFYLKNNFKPYATREFPLGECEQTDFLMRREISK